MRLEDFTEAQPSPNYRPGAPSMHDVAAALHAIRKDHGYRKYRSILHPVNGRTAPIDKVQESLDGLVYDIQTACEWQAMVDALKEFRARLYDDHVRREREDPEGYTVTAEQIWREFLLFFDVRNLAERADGLAAGLLAQAEQAREPVDVEVADLGEVVERVRRGE